MNLERHRTPLWHPAARIGAIVRCIEPIFPLVYDRDYLVTDVIWSLGPCVRVQELLTDIIPDQDWNGWWPWRFKVLADLRNVHRAPR